MMRERKEFLQENPEAMEVLNYLESIGLADSISNFFQKESVKELICKYSEKLRKDIDVTCECVPYLSEDDIKQIKKNCNGEKNFFDFIAELIMMNEIASICGATSDYMDISAMVKMFEEAFSAENDSKLLNRLEDILNILIKQTIDVCEQIIEAEIFAKDPIKAIPRGVIVVGLDGKTFGEDPFGNGGIPS